MGNVSKCKWNMLDSYCEGQAIFGRDTEIRNITESIVDNVQTFVYGKSGVGKTSLIQAGVFPKLRRANFFPVIVRLTFYAGRPFNSVIKELVEQEAQREDLTINKQSLTKTIIDDIDTATCSLFEYFSKVKFEDKENNAFIPVLIFDQFEESINNEENWQNTVDFLKDELYDLMDNSTIVYGDNLPYTNYRIVLSMREDYLYCLEDIIDNYNLGELHYNRFRIRALSDDKAADVIRLTSGTNGLEAGNEKNIVRTIIKLSKLDSDARFSEINTAMLSLISSLLNENSVDGVIRYKDLRYISSYLNAYYDSLFDVVGTSGTRYLENHLLTKDGRRSSVDRCEAIDSGKVTQKQLDYLVDRRILRQINVGGGAVRYEYIHDLFAKIVFKRISEARDRFLQPELWSVSKKMDRWSFIKRFVYITLAIVALMFVCIGLSTDFEFNVWEKEAIYNSFLFFLIYVVYLTPLVVKRLHDINLSGWWSLLAPISIGMISFPSFMDFGELSENILVGFGMLFILLSIFVLFMFPSAKSSHRGLCSMKYEMAYNGAYITNKAFAKLFSLEFLCFCVAFSFSQLLISCYLKQPVGWFYQKNGYDVPLFLVFAYLLFIFSPALQARNKSIGNKNWVTYIPIVNILFLIEGLLPDNLLRKLGVLKDSRQENRDIFGAVYDQFSTIAYSAKVKKRRNAKNKFETLILSLLMLVIPFFALYRTLNKRTIIGKRYYSLLYVFLNASIICGCGIACIIDEIGIVVNLVIATLISPILLIIGVYLDYRLKVHVINVIKSNPTYTIEDIVAELQAPVRRVTMIMKDLKQNGVLEKSMTDDNKETWIVYEN